MSARTPYYKKLQDSRWQMKRLEIMNRDAAVCRVCYAEDKRMLNVHHHYYEKGRDPWDYPDGALITLCEDHHKELEEAKLTFLKLGVSADEFMRLSQLLVAMRGMNGRHLSLLHFMNAAIAFLDGFRDCSVAEHDEDAVPLNDMRQHLGYLVTVASNASECAIRNYLSRPPVVASAQPVLDDSDWPADGVFKECPAPESYSE